MIDLKRAVFTAAVFDLYLILRLMAVLSVTGIAEIMSAKTVIKSL